MSIVAQIAAHVLDAEFVAAVLAALSIPLVVAASVALMVITPTGTSKVSEQSVGRDAPLTRRAFRGIGPRSRRSLPARPVK